jgi:hypothetical protein
VEERRRNEEEGERERCVRAWGRRSREEKKREKEEFSGEGEKREKRKRKEKEKEREREEREEVGHLSHCEWLEEDKDIFSSQPGNDMWQDKIFLLLKAPNYYKLQQDPILPKS